jgi:hypothetical protein
MMIPYVDNVVGDTGIWFSTMIGKRAALISGIYTIILLPVLILFDAYVGLRPAVRLIPGMEAFGLTDIVAEVLIPIAVMVGLPAILVLLLRPLKPSRRDVLIGLFSAFVVTYIFLTIIGTAFRGHGMQLFWPWDIGAPIE